MLQKKASNRPKFSAKLSKTVEKSPATMEEFPTSPTPDISPQYPLDSNISSPTSVILLSKQKACNFSHAITTLEILSPQYLFPPTSPTPDIFPQHLLFPEIVSPTSVILPSTQKACNMPPTLKILSPQYLFPPNISNHDC